MYEVRALVRCERRIAEGNIVNVIPTVGEAPPRL